MPGPCHPAPSCLPFATLTTGHRRSPAAGEPREAQYLRVRVRARVTWDLLGYNGPVTLQILLTNDDGLHAPGLAVLRGALDGLGDDRAPSPPTTTPAPWHAASPSRRPLHVREERFGEGWPGFTCDGTPSDCVRVALVGVRCPVPDLVVSGVNAGSNMGADITYSGTVGAAFEAALRGFPALAFSVESETPGWLPEAAPVIRAVVGHVIARGLPQHTILNVNLPDRPLAGFTGIHPARLGGASCYDYVVLAAEEGRAALTRPPGSTRCCVTTRRRCTAPRPTSMWSRRAPWR